ncbi:MAG TPA: divalent metal cation transporter, partial [Clostridiales bacterium]|nr:divalent metal cation transporter [Clostridiales bacterium]
MDSDGKLSGIDIGKGTLMPLVKGKRGVSKFQLKIKQLLKFLGPAFIVSVAYV